MEHTMNLVPWAFEEVKSGRKDIEVRLNDEKRQKMNVGDIIVFTNTETASHKPIKPMVRVPFLNISEASFFSEPE